MIFQSNWGQSKISQSKWSQSKQFPSQNDPSTVDPSPINPSLNDSGPFILVVKSLKRETFQWLALLAGQRCCLLRHFFRSERLAGGQKAAPLLSSGDGSAWQDCCSTQKLKAFSFRTGRLTRKRFHRFLCIIVSTAFYRLPCWSRHFLPHQPWQEMPHHHFLVPLFPQIIWGWFALPPGRLLSPVFLGPSEGLGYCPSVEIETVPGHSDPPDVSRNCVAKRWEASPGSRFWVTSVSWRGQGGLEGLVTWVASVVSRAVDTEARFPIGWAGFPAKISGAYSTLA